jgi:hypothetical protein
MYCLAETGLVRVTIVLMVGLEIVSVQNVEANFEYCCTAAQKREEMAV